MSTTTQMTAEELAQLPRGRSRYELVRGELRTMSPAGAKHGVVAMIIGAHLCQYVQRHHLGHVFAAETGFLIETTPDSVRAADISFVTLARLPIVPDEPAFLRLAPDLAIEVLSPNDTEAEWTEKSLDWLSGGTQTVVIVDPRRRTVQIISAQRPTISLTDEDVLELPALIPGWSMPIQQMFG